MLYPKEYKEQSKLLFSCRNCNYTELADDPKVYRHELKADMGETAGVVQDIGADPTLPRTDKECPYCHAANCVFFQSQIRRKDTSMVLFYVCLNCSKTFKGVWSGIIGILVIGWRCCNILYCMYLTVCVLFSLV